MNHYFYDKKPHLLNTINAASTTLTTDCGMIRSVQNVYIIGQHSLSLSFQPFEQRFEKMNKKIVF